MASNSATADLSLSRRRIGWSETTMLVVAALACAAGTAAWIADAGQATATALPENSDIAFDDRFVGASPSESSGRNVVLQPLDRSALAARAMQVRSAKGLLARQLSSLDWRAAGVDEANISEARPNEARPNEAKPNEAKPWASVDIPLPRSRPVAADMEASAVSGPAQADAAARQDNRTLLQKLSDLLPGRVTLASLGPDGGLFRQGPGLASLGYDGHTAVYDISAKAVYLPDGSSLEAHSGIGSVRDDPEHVDKSNVGATPPAVYELKPRSAVSRRSGAADDPRRRQHDAWAFRAARA